MANSRPTKYTPKLGQLICDKIATSTTGLVKLCNAEDLPLHATVLSWLNDPKKKDFLQNYLRAREAQTDLLNDEIIEIADEAHTEKDTPTSVSRARLRMDARKWKVSKLAPKKNGDKDADEKRGGEGKGNVVKWGDLKIAV